MGVLALTNVFRVSNLSSDKRIIPPGKSLNPTKTQKQMINAYRMSTVLNLVLKGFFSLLILFPFDSLKAETKILIGSIRSLNATESKEIEALIQKEFSESSDPFVFYIKPMESINKGIIEARTGGYQIYS